MVNWEPTSTLLPQFKERPMSSEKWKATISEIYSYLNRIRPFTTEITEEPLSPSVGAVWFDISDSLNPKLKIFDGEVWCYILLTKEV